MTLPRKFPVNANILKRIKKTIEPKETETYLTNRNPRNLEFLRIARKPIGYKLDVPGRKFWNKLNLTTTGKYITAELVHHENGAVVGASTSEWAIKKQLFKTTDISAYVNLGRVFAQRCLESGFIEMTCDLKPAKETKAAAFLKTLKDGGLYLKEPNNVRLQKEVNQFVGRKQKPYGDWEEH